MIDVYIKGYFGNCKEVLEKMDEAKISYNVKIIGDDISEPLFMAKDEDIQYYSCPWIFENDVYVGPSSMYLLKMGI